jgi:hypothetical protein
VQSGSRKLGLRSFETTRSLLRDLSDSGIHLDLSHCLNAFPSRTNILNDLDFESGHLAQYPNSSNYWNSYDLR